VVATEEWWCWNIAVTILVSFVPVTISTPFVVISIFRFTVVIVVFAMIPSKVIWQKSWVDSKEGCVSTSKLTKKLLVHGHLRDGMDAVSGHASNAFGS
jgi:hypothetical protein